ncbi:MAG TPA: creatininase family protein [Armatimonadetes bacterium]|nr:creatininase family protein [Armatimonadota bacterium]
MLEAATATWPEVATYVQENPTAIWPLGATEQHGPHLPLATDTLLAEALARRVAREVGGLLLPPLPLSYSWVWRDIPGTLTLRVETFLAVVKDVVRSLQRTGIRAALLVNGHAANQQPLKYALRELADELTLPILYVFYPGLEEVTRDTTLSPRWQPHTFHACEIETSLFLAVCPALCRPERAVREYPPVPPHFERSALSMGHLSQSGVFGDATVADAERGQAWWEAVVQETVHLWREFLAQHDLP